MVPLHQTAQGLRPCGMALYDMLADLSAELNDKPVPALTRHAVNFADGSDGLRGKVWRERGHLLQEAGEGMSVVSFSQFVGDAASRGSRLVWPANATGTHSLYPTTSAHLPFCPTGS